jgi:EAL domain-containing protein (putative c-di-GMP-specific phosphodiesterase class I)
VKTRNLEGYMNSIAPPAPVTGIDATHGVAPDYLCPVFQPIFDRQQSLVAYEALLRVVGQCGRERAIGPWIAEHETRGTIGHVDVAMVEKVARTLSGAQVPAVTVNVSLYTLEQHFARYLHATHALHELGRRVIVELTESAPIIDTTALAEMVGVMRARGLLVAFDDASDQHPYGHPEIISTIRPDLVKIDGAFFHACAADRERRRNLDRIIGASHAAGSLVVVEWVDSAERLAAALHAGADWVQGYHLSRPSPQWAAAHCIGAGQAQCAHSPCPLNPTGDCV